MAGIENPQEIAFSIVPFIDPDHIVRKCFTKIFYKQSSYSQF